MKRSEHLLGSAPKHAEEKPLGKDPLDITAVAPYQAMPVIGPLISQHKASGLEVLSSDGTQLGDKVRSAFKGSRSSSNALLLEAGA